MGTNNHFTSLDLIELETDAIFFLYFKQICLDRKNSTAWLKKNLKYKKIIQSFKYKNYFL